MKAARKAPTCYGGGTEEEGHGWEYLCEWEGEQSDSWVWHDKMPHTWERELMHAQGARVAARIGDRLRREIGRGRRPRVGDG